MAELYISQGHLKDALEIYDYLLAKDPENQEIKSRIDLLISQNEEVSKNRKKILALQSWLKQVKDRAAFYESRGNSKGDGPSG